MPLSTATNFSLRTLGLVLISALLLVLFWLQSDEKAAVTKEKHKPKAYMKNVVVSQYHDTGRIRHKLSASQWSFWEKSGVSELVDPHLRAYRPHHDTWHVQAKQGLVHHRSMEGPIEQIELINDVIIQQPTMDNAPGVVMKTSVLYYDPRKSYVETQARVFMQKPRFQISGRGLRGYLDRDWLEILHNVKTIYSQS